MNFASGLGRHLTLQQQDRSTAQNHCSITGRIISNPGIEVCRLGCRQVCVPVTNRVVDVKARGAIPRLGHGRVRKGKRQTGWLSEIKALLITIGVCPRAASLTQGGEFEVSARYCGSLEGLIRRLVVHIW